MPNRLTLLRAALNAQKLDGFILPVNDEFMGEYIPDSAKRLEWLTGFTGSAGLAAVLREKAAFFTDGRYTLQAEAEVAEGFERFNSAARPPEEWLKQHGAEAVIGYDPRLHTLAALRRYERAAPLVHFVPVAANPVDLLWQDRPATPASRVEMHPLEYAGEAASGKITRMAGKLSALGADAEIITAPDAVCWLLNIRGSDVPFTPFVLAFALLTAKGGVTLFVDPARVQPECREHLRAVELAVPEMLSPGNDTALPALWAKLAGQKILYDPASSPIWFYQQLIAAGAEIIEAPDPCMAAKARKNPVELEGARQAHIRDGLAETRFLCWLDGAVAAGEALTEMAVAEKLESFRKASPLYREPSFSTIAGSGPNGAIVHYRPHDKSNRPLDINSLLLLDSGGQYPDGTTDITRTIALGMPSAEMKDRFTRVLKGHIALARAVFPEGTTGGQLDGLARQFLWEAGLDYDHGTGHGVGSYLSVHEGPQRISKRGGDAALELGMILSNEPGYYKTGAYGIRIENLVAVVEAGQKRFLAFETLTLVPVDVRLIEQSLLTAEEIRWLNDYHARVLATHTANLTAPEMEWLKKFILSSSGGSEAA